MEQISSLYACVSEREICQSPSVKNMPDIIIRRTAPPSGVLPV